MEPVETIIELLKLKPHPEGGYFRETYRSEGIISQQCLNHQYSSQRNFSTCIYYLLNGNDFSLLHRLVQDETWHFYYGSPIALQMITPLGYHIEVILGPEFGRGHVFHYTIPGGTWFGAKPLNLEAYSLFGCTVSPGFTFADFRLADRDELIRQYPQYTDLITEYTKV